MLGTKSSTHHKVTFAPKLDQASTKPLTALTQHEIDRMSPKERIKLSKQCLDNDPSSYDLCTAALKLCYDVANDSIDLAYYIHLANVLRSICINFAESDEFRTAFISECSSRNPGKDNPELIILRYYLSQAFEWTDKVVQKLERIDSKISKISTTAILADIIEMFYITYPYFKKHDKYHSLVTYIVSSSQFLLTHTYGQEYSHDILEKLNYMLKTVPSETHFCMNEQNTTADENDTAILGEMNETSE